MDNTYSTPFFLVSLFHKLAFWFNFLLIIITYYVLLLCTFELFSMCVRQTTFHLLLFTFSLILSVGNNKFTFSFYLVLRFLFTSWISDCFQSIEKVRYTFPSKIIFHCLECIASTFQVSLFHNWAYGFLLHIQDIWAVLASMITRKCENWLNSGLICCVSLHKILD